MTKSLKQVEGIDYRKINHVSLPCIKLIPSQIVSLIISPFNTHESSSPNLRTKHNENQFKVSKYFISVQQSSMRKINKRVSFQIKIIIAVVYGSIDLLWKMERIVIAQMFCAHFEGNFQACSQVLSTPHVHWKMIAHFTLMEFQCDECMRQR